MPLSPLLAPSETLTDATAQTLRYPVLVSPKYDGIRATVQSGELLSRTGKPIPNVHISVALSGLEGCDGELVCGDPTAIGGFNRTQSAVMRASGRPDDWTYYVFDLIGDPRPFRDRVIALHGFASDRVVCVPQTLARNAAELLAIERSHRLAGWEGVMVRDPHGAYPQKTNGEMRATVRQQNILKFKRFEDSEGLIVDVYSGADGVSIGGFLLRDDTQGWACRVGTGRLTAIQLARVQHAPSDYVGSHALKYQFQRVGTGALPRFPTAQGFRSLGE